MLTVKQAATKAGVSPGLVYLWCAERRLPHVRAGGMGRRGRILIEESDLADLLASCRVLADVLPQIKQPPPKGAGAFRNLDSDRLQEAWRKRGVLGKG